MPFAHDIYGVAVVLVDEISHFSMSLNLVGLGRYRVILHADIIHLKRADGNRIDALLHVEAWDQGELEGTLQWAFDLLLDLVRRALV